MPVCNKDSIKCIIVSWFANFIVEMIVNMKNNIDFAQFADSE